MKQHTVKVAPNAAQRLWSEAAKGQLLEESRTYMGSLAALRIVTDLSRAAIDVRLVDPARNSTPSPKLQAAAQNIVASWMESRAHLAALGADSAVRSGLQLVFCDVGLKPLSDLMRGLLHSRGVPPGQIRSTAEAQSTDDLAELIADCRDGQASVLLAATQDIQLGWNVNRRAIAVHHLDCPAGVSDLNERERFLSMVGNKVIQAGVAPSSYRYITEGTVDVLNWRAVDDEVKLARGGYRMAARNAALGMPEGLTSRMLHTAQPANPAAYVNMADYRPAGLNTDKGTER